MEEHEPHSNEVFHQVASIVSAYVSHNSMRASDLPELIMMVNDALTRLARTQPVNEAEATRAAPAVSVKKSVQRDYLVCLEDGKKFKSLRRHLASFHGLTPEAYREKWSLPSDYPMVAPSYSETRSRLARHTGLGQTGGRSAQAEPDAELDAQPATEAPATKARRGRAKSGAE